MVVHRGCPSWVGLGYEETGLLKAVPDARFEASKIAGRNAGPGSPGVDTVRESRERKKRPLAPGVFWDPRQSQRDDVESASQQEFCCYCWA